MSLEIREMRAGDYTQLAALWREGGGVASVTNEAALENVLRRNRALSIVALRDSKLLCAVLCVRNGTAGCTNTLVTDPAAADNGLVTMLLGKALIKMASHGVHRFRIVEKPHRDDTSVWPFLRCTDDNGSPRPAAEAYGVDIVDNQSEAPRFPPEGGGVDRVKSRP